MSTSIREHILHHPDVQKARARGGFVVVAPIMPFLKARAHYTNDKTLRERIEMIVKRNLIPNTPEWNKALGTEGPVICHYHPDGRFLLSVDDIVDAAPAQSQEDGNGAA